MKVIISGATSFPLDNFASNFRIEIFIVLLTLVETHLVYRFRRGHEKGNEFYHASTESQLLWRPLDLVLVKQAKGGVLFSTPPLQSSHIDMASILRPLFSPAPKPGLPLPAPHLQAPNLAPPAPPRYTTLAGQTPGAVLAQLVEQLIRNQ